MHADRELTDIATAIGHPARARMLSALLGGRALTARELALAARIKAPTASVHLARLVDAGLVEQRPTGRHRYHRLASDEVAHAIEALAALAAPEPVRSLRASAQALAERAARCCYDHLAGALGVGIADRLCTMGALEPASLSLRDPAPFRALGIEPDGLRAGRRPLTRACLDWSERRFHLAGALGAALLQRARDDGWVEHGPRGRALLVTSHGRAVFSERLGLESDVLATIAQS
jgi:DNA-binding transcriptional ArsR family regulator